MNENPNNFQIEHTNISPEIQVQNMAEQEKETPLESVDVLSSYISKKEEVQKQIKEVLNTTQTLVEEIKEVRTQLGLSSSSEDTPSIEALKEKLQNLIQEQIKVSANYPGDWTLLLQERMLDPITKEKFIQTREESMLEMQQGEPGLMDKPKKFAGHYQDQIDRYDENVESIFSSTGYIEGGLNSKKLGTSNIGLTGTVYIDAIKSDKTELTPRQKNIVEAHEKGHGLRDFHSPIDGRDFRSSIDSEIISIAQEEERKQRSEANFANYMNTAEEIAERMAQLKNYFGMKAGDTFTKDHLRYAANNYITDTGLDNNMTLFFKAITERNEDKFIDTINKYPL